ncbi:MAG: MarR family transcriptional regulator [Chthoniobacteraceae bacterium]|jgi:DNA-binding MarR family transcriptional regulator
MSTSRSNSQIRRDCEKLADMFTVLQRCFLMNLSKELARGKVSFPQYFLLGFLAQQKRLTMSEIAAKMGHTTAAATGLVDRLEKLGYVRRMHASDDRRKIEVQITPPGQSLVEQIREDMVTSLGEMMTLLSPSEQRAWVQVYEKIFACVTQQNR